MTKDELLELIDTNLPTNGVGAITASDLRAVLDEMVDSTAPDSPVLYHPGEFVPANGRDFPGTPA